MPRRSPSAEHELITWLNFNEIIGFNTASLAPAANYCGKGHAMAFTGPGIACDWLDIEGPLHDVWPPASPSASLRRSAARRVQSQPSIPASSPPRRMQVRQIGAGKNRPDPVAGPLDRQQRASRSPMPIVCSRPSCRGPFAGRWTRRSARLTSPRSRSV